MKKRIFSANLTSELLVDSTINEAKLPIGNVDKYKLLDLGSGGGYVGVEIAKSLGLPRVWSSDLDEATLEVATDAAKASTLKIDHRIGSLFSPWEGERFDLIIDDVSGVSSPIAEISPWFQGVPCESGECGTILVNRVLQQANKYLTDKGQIIFPVISLSAVNKIILAAKKNFAHVKRLKRKEWPLPKSMLEFEEILRKHKESQNIFYEEKYGMIVCYTEIYLAHN